MKKLITIICLLTLIIQSLNAQCWRSRADWEKYFKSSINKLDPIEGIWSNSNTVKIYDQYNRLRQSKYNSQAQTVAIYKDGDVYKTCVIGGTETFKIKFENSATSGIYLMQLTYNATYASVKADAVLTGNGLLEFSYYKPANQLKHELGANYIQGMSLTFEHSWIKISPKSSDYKEIQPSSGTGFAISSDGFIVTNHHVVKDASNIRVRGIKGDFSRAYSAKIVAEDKNNDLALIKISDTAFTTLGIPPYTVSNSSADVGNNVFVLGYPLRATMGDEIKLTNGIVSSKSGFQGDITSYQISAPVQPGNSGGPVFDEDGKVIGIINAKHLGAENASYAVKINYLTNLIDILDRKPKLATTNTLTGKGLSDQIKYAKEFVYIIEVN